MSEESLSGGFFLFGGAPEPVDRLRVVLRHAEPVVIRVSEESLPGGISLLGGEPGPPDGLPVVLRHAETVVVRRPEAGLPDGVSLFGGESGPPDGLPVVLPNAVPEASPARSPKYASPSRACPTGCPCTAASRDQWTASP